MSLSSENVHVHPGRLAVGAAGPAACKTPGEQWAGTLATCTRWTSNLGLWKRRVSDWPITVSATLRFHRPNVRVRARPLARNEMLPARMNTFLPFLSSESFPLAHNNLHELNETLCRYGHDVCLAGCRRCAWFAQPSAGAKIHGLPASAQLCVIV